MTSRPGMPNFRIAVVGSGAVGCYYGARLARSGFDVHFLMRGDFEHVREHGIRVRSKDGDFNLAEVNCYQTTSEIGACDLVIIALKATANDALTVLVPPLLKLDTMLLTLQNGLGNEAFLGRAFGADRVLGGLCFVCINRTGPGVIEHSAQGIISLGEYQGGSLPRTHEVSRALACSGINVRVVEDLALERWRKLVWNIPFNGLSIAAGGIDVGQILGDDHLHCLTRALMGEVITIANALGHDIPMSFIDDNIEQTKGMGAYRPSSLIDYLAGREVEVETIWGEPYRIASEAGVECGRLETLLRLLKFAAASRNSECAL